MRALMLGVLLVFSSLIHAANDTAVQQWAKKTLLKTLSVNYRYNSNEPNESRINFTINAWNALGSFLNFTVILFLTKFFPIS